MIFTAPQPHPDPAPGSKGPPVMVGYDYTIGGYAAGRLVRGVEFRCHVYVNGVRRCVLIRLPKGWHRVGRVAGGVTIAPDGARPTRATPAAAGRQEESHT